MVGIGESIHNRCPGPWLKKYTGSKTPPGLGPKKKSSPEQGPKIFALWGRDLKNMLGPWPHRGRPTGPADTA